MKKNLQKETSQESWRMWTITLLALGFAALVITLLSRQNTSLHNVLGDLQGQVGLAQGGASEAESTCDVGERCIQEGKHEGGYFGIAQMEAHVIEDVTYEGVDGSETCHMMQVDAVNDPRAQEEINMAGNGQGSFVVSQEDAERFATTTAEAPASLLVYITERIGRETGPCYVRVHIVN